MVDTVQDTTACPRQAIVGCSTGKGVDDVCNGFDLITYVKETNLIGGGYSARKCKDRWRMHSDRSIGHHSTTRTTCSDLVVVRYRWRGKCC